MQSTWQEIDPGQGLVPINIVPPAVLGKPAAIGVIVGTAAPTISVM
jgi:hypothetical protein